MEKKQLYIILCILLVTNIFTFNFFYHKIEKINLNHEIEIIHLNAIHHIELYECRTKKIDKMGNGITQEFLNKLEKEMEEINDDIVGVFKYLFKDFFKN